MSDKQPMGDDEFTPTNPGTPGEGAPFHQVRVSLFEKDTLRGLATVKVLDLVYLTGLRIVEGKAGLFVSMPNRRTAGGEYQDVFFPANKARRDELARLVLAAYYKEAKTTAEAVNEVIKAKRAAKEKADAEAQGGGGTPA